MDNNTEIIFTELGGSFCRPFAEFKERLAKIKAYIFDWDGVFNNGVKTGQSGSPFNEIDAMGTNMLRLGHWLKNNSLPVMAVITGLRAFRKACRQITCLRDNPFAYAVRIKS